jgi:hypothetical protein
MPLIYCDHMAMLQSSYCVLLYNYRCMYDGHDRNTCGNLPVSEGPLGSSRNLKHVQVDARWHFNFKIKHITWDPSLLIYFVIYNRTEWSYNRIQNKRAGADFRLGILYHYTVSTIMYVNKKWGNWRVSDPIVS